MLLLNILLLTISGMGSTLEKNTIADPITWTFTVEKVSDNEFDMEATADIEKGWYLYSQDNTDEGPVPTSFTFDKMETITMAQNVKEEGDLIKKQDDMFDMVIAKYKSKVTFRQRYQSTDAKGSIKGYVTYMTCDGLRCLPPKDVEFNISL